MGPALELALTAESGEAVGEGFGVEKPFVAAQEGGAVAESLGVIQQSSLEITGAADIKMAGQ